MGADDVLAHVLGVRARVAQAVEPVDGVQRVQQLGERPAVRTQVAPVGVDVLAEQRDLARAVGDLGADLLDELVERPRHLAPARGGHDAVRAAAVAADRDLHPGLELAGALGRQVAGEALELEVALRAERVGGQELGELVDLARAEGDVDERELAEDVVLDRLRPAAADADDDVGPRALDALGLVQVGDEAAVGRLADRARVEEDEVGVVALRRLGVAQRLEHALHALGVVLVHLAPERRDVEALGGRHGSPQGTGAGARQSRGGQGAGTRGVAAREIRVGLLGRAGVARDRGAVAGGELVDRVLGLLDVRPARADHEDHARTVAGADRDVVGPGRAVQVVPLAHAALLALDDRDALAAEDEEALLGGFGVVAPVGLARHEHVRADPELREAERRRRRDRTTRRGRHRAPSSPRRG